MRASHFFSRSRVLGVVAGLTLTAALMAGPASTEGRRFDIPTQSLDTALTLFGQQSDREIVFSPEVARAKRAPAVVGEMNPLKALEAILAGSGLSYKVTGDGTIVVGRPEDLAHSEAGSKGLMLAQGEREHGNESNVAEEKRTGPTDGGQEESEQLEEIVVTGTHIRGTQNRTAPLVVIDREQIERTGYATTQDLIRSLPQNFVGGEAGASEDGRFGVSSRAGSNFTAATGINLRGLGNSSTLVLLNGHRIAPSAYGSIIDVSLIPLAAIERIEILLDGSSALYGSDAVGGVVNIITRSDFEGVSTSVRYGAASDSSRSERIISQAAGGHWSSGSLVATAQYQDQRELRARDRGFAGALTQPNDLLPAAENYGIALNARQRLSDNLELYGDSLLSRRDIERKTSFRCILMTAWASQECVTPLISGNRMPRWSSNPEWI